MQHPCSDWYEARPFRDGLSRGRLGLENLVRPSDQTQEVMDLLDTRYDGDFRYVAGKSMLWAGAGVGLVMFCSAPFYFGR